MRAITAIIGFWLGAGLWGIQAAWAAQGMEVTSDEVLIFSSPDLASDPLETASRGDLYRAGDRSYRGFYKVELRKHRETGKFGWIPENSVRSLPVEKAVTVTEDAAWSLQLSRFAIEFGAMAISANPKELQTAIGLPESSTNGTSLGGAISIRAGSSFRFALGGATLSLPQAGTATANYSFSGNWFSAHLDYDWIRLGDFAMSLGLGGGAVMGTLTVTPPSGTVFTSPSILVGMWDPRVSVRWNFIGHWNAVLRLGRMFIAESRQTFQTPNVFVNLTNWNGQIAFCYGF